MPHTWTARQFVGGTVALDFANTVCYRSDPIRRFDKITDGSELRAFAEAALHHSDAGGWAAAAPPADLDDVLLTFFRAVREAVDELFRPLAAGKTPRVPAFQAILRLHHDLLAGGGIRLGASGLELDPGDAPGFVLVVTQSALRLALSAELARLRICPNCRWLFIDRSRNVSRIWCDMLTCGNRSKARRHYERRRATASAEPV